MTSTGAGGVTITKNGIFVGVPLDVFLKGVDDAVLKAMDEEAFRYQAKVQEKMLDSPHGFKQTVYTGAMINSIEARPSEGSLKAGGYRGGLLANRSKFAGGLYHAWFIEHGRKAGKGIAFTETVVQTPKEAAVRAHTRNVGGASIAVRGHTRATKGSRRVKVYAIDQWIQRRMGVTGTDLGAMLERQGIGFRMSQRQRAHGMEPRRPFGRANDELGPGAKKRLGDAIRRAVGAE